MSGPQLRRELPAGADRRLAHRGHLRAHVRRPERDLRRHARHQFRAGRLHDARHVRGLLRVRPARGAHRLRPRNCARIMAALLAGPIIFVAGVVVHKLLVSRVTGIRGSALRVRRALRAADPDARHRADSAERRAVCVRLGAGVDRDAAVVAARGPSARCTAMRSRSSSTRARPWRR